SRRASAIARRKADPARDRPLSLRAHRDACDDDRMALTISTDPARIDLDRVNAWLRAAYWSPNVRRDVVERAFAHSLVAGAYDDRGVQRGVARAVTDHATFAYL